MEDAENQFAGSQPGNAGCLRPVSSRPQEAQLLPQVTAPAEAAGLPALGRRLPTCGGPRATGGALPAGTAALRPVSTSSSWIGNQGRATLTEVLEEPGRPQSSASHPQLTFRSKEEVIGGFEGPEQDEFDKVLASMELEGPSLELQLGVQSEAAGILPSWQQEDSTPAKKARVADLSRPCQRGPVPSPHVTGIPSAPDPTVLCRTPEPHLRPGTTFLFQLPQWFVLSHPTGKSLLWVPLLEHLSLSKLLAGPFRAALKIVSLLSHSGLQTPVQVANSVFLDPGLPTHAVLLPQRPAVDCFLRVHPNPELQRLLSCLLSAPRRVPVPLRSLKPLCRRPSSPTTWCGWSPLPAGHRSNPPAPPPGPRCAVSPAQQGSCLTR